MPKGQYIDADFSRRAALIRWARVRGEEVPSSRKGSPEARVRSRFGKASEYDCAFCTCRAHDWAWVHGMDREDVRSYFPLCRQCHCWYDGTVRNLRIGNSNPWTESRRLRYNQTIAERRERTLNA
jgi:hypothetical protein